MSKLINGKTGDWEIVIGIEVHAQIISQSKLFSGSSTSFGSEHNTQVSFVDAGMPGMLPVINSVCVEQAVKTGLGLNAKINKFSIFDRKNYFYPDLPQGYQISQFEQPIVGEGKVIIDLEKGVEKEVRIERLHLEQDAGKSIHDLFDGETGVDLNRAGTPLLEIVSEPDMRTAKEAVAYARYIHQLVTYLGVSDGNMSEGSLRCDANVSIRPMGGTKMGTRTETKNVNSFKFLENAINFEASRTDLNNIWLQKVESILEEFYGDKIHVIPNLAGSLPNNCFTDILEIPTIWIPHSYKECSQHAPNEHLPIDLLKDSLLLMTNLYCIVNIKQIHTQSAI